MGDGCFLGVLNRVRLELRDLISQCLSFDPCHRPELEDLLSHPWSTMPTPEWVTLAKLMDAIPEDKQNTATACDNPKETFKRQMSRTVPDVILEERMLEATCSLIRHYV